MKYSVITLSIVLLFATAGQADPEAVVEAKPIVVAQASTPAPKPATPETPPAKADETEAAADDEPIEATVSGDYEEDEDTFIPSQEVSSDQSLNFPVDI